MGLDEEIVMSDIDENNWYLTIKLNSKVKKVDIINSVIKALRQEELKLMGKLPKTDMYKYISVSRALYIENDINTQ